MLISKRCLCDYVLVNYKLNNTLKKVGKFMKKKILLLSILLILIVNVTLNIGFKLNKETDNNITIKTYIDGKLAAAFPSSTDGYKVSSITCTNGATGTFNYSTWRLEATNVTSNTVCKRSFVSNDNSTFATYLKNKECTSTPTSDTAAKDCLVNESLILSDYTNASALNKSQYGSVNQYYSSSVSSTSGTSVTDLFTFNNSTYEWESAIDKLSESSYNHMQMTIPEEGYYQLCYTLSSGHKSNRLYIYKESTLLDSISVSTSSSTTDCINLNNLTAGTKMTIVMLAYSNTSYPTRATVNFKLEKGTAFQDDTYRYEGSNPNNYVLFNDELWQIIGVFNVKNSSGTSQDLVKLVRGETLYNLAWNDTININDWNDVTLQSQLNNGYLNAADATCNVYGTVTRTCKFSETGIKSIARNMIESVVWNLGGVGNYAETAENFYKAERGELVSSGNATIWTGKVGLMYPSDYGYSMLASSCARTTISDSYNSAACSGNSWLYKYGPQWLLTTNYYYNSAVFTIDYFGMLYLDGDIHNLNSLYDNNGVRPAIYLKSSIKYVSGSGTYSDPYQIS